MKKINIKSLIIFLAVILIITVALIIFYQEILHIFTKLIAGSQDLRDYINSLGWLGNFIIVFLQMLQVIVTVFPSEPIMVVSGIAYGPFFGALFCVLGVLIGNQIVFLLNRSFSSIFSSARSIEKRRLFEEKIARSNRKLGLLVYILYVIPAVPFGLIAIIASSSKMKWWKYTLATSLGCITPIFLTVFVGSAMVSFSSKVTLFMFVVVLLIVIFVIFNKKRILEVILRDANLSRRITNMEIKQPNRFVYAFFANFFRKTLIKKNNVNVIDNVNIKELKGPFMVLSNHPSRIDYIYVGTIFRPHRLNFVTDYYMFRVRYLHLLLKLLGAIPKKLFHPDTVCVKNILKVIKKGGNVCLFPEGILSASGSNQPVRESTSKLLFKLKVPVIRCMISGAYLTRPKYLKENKIGAVDITVDYLFKESDYDVLSLEDIDLKLKESFKYNDFQWLKDKNISYIGNDKAKNLNGILYICPKCGKEFTLTSENNSICCNNCDLIGTLDDKYTFNYKEGNYFSDINEWYRYQRMKIREEVRNPDFKLEGKSIIKRFSRKIRKNPEVYAGEGKVTLDKTGLLYEGTMFNKEVSLMIPSLELPSMSYAAGAYFELYYQNTYYAFHLEEGVKSVKYVLAAEEIHKMNLGESYE